MKLNVREIELQMAEQGLTVNDLVVKSRSTYKTLKKAFALNEVKPITAGKIAQALGVDVAEIVRED